MDWKLLCLLALAIIGLTCKKPEDKIPPQINLLTPTKNQGYSDVDTIFINCQISDNIIIKSIDASILDKNQKPVKFLISLRPETSSYNLSIDFPIKDVDFTDEESDYFLKVTASDGNNQAYDLVEFQKYNTTKSIKQILIISKSNNSTTRLTRIDSIYNLTPVLSLNSDYGSSCQSENTEQMFLCGNMSGDIYSINGKDGSINWEIKNDHISGFPGYTSIFFKSNQLFAAHYNGNIKVFNTFGSTIYNFDLQDLNFARKINHQNQLLQTYETNLSQNKKQIANYFFPSGTLKQSTSIDFDINTLFYLANNTTLLFCNKNNESFVKLYYNEYNTISQIKLLPYGNIKSVEVKKDNIYLINHSQGIYEYNYSTNTLIKIFNQNASSIAKYDELKKLYYIANSNKLSIYNEYPLELIKLIEVNDTILDFYFIKEAKSQ